jgi:hypothetical protein
MVLLAMIMSLDDAAAVVAMVAVAVAVAVANCCS